MSLNRPGCSNFHRNVPDVAHQQHPVPTSDFNGWRRNPTISDDYYVLIVIEVFGVLALCLEWSRYTRWILILPWWCVGLVAGQFLKCWVWQLAGGSLSDGTSSDSFLSLTQQGAVAHWFNPAFTVAEGALLVVFALGTFALLIPWNWARSSETMLTMGGTAISASCYRFVARIRAKPISVP